MNDCPIGACASIEKPMHVCKECAKKEEAWQKIEYYMSRCDIGLSRSFLREYYLSYYVKGLYCNSIMKDIFEKYKEECKFLFEEK